MTDRGRYQELQIKKYTPSCRDNFYMRVIVLGGNGFIGKNVAKHFQNNNYSTATYDLCASSSNENSYSGDIATDPELPSILRKYDVLIYLVSSVTPQRSMEDPGSAYSADICNILRVLDVCRSCGIKRTIFASSGGTVYGDSGIKNIETQNTFPISHYGACKIACEKIILMNNLLYGMENVILRISNPYGAGQRIASGVGAVTAFANQISLDQPIVIFGDGENVRDFVNIDYVADAFLSAARWEYDDNVSPIFNIGSGADITLNKVIKILAQAMHKQPKVDRHPSRAFDVRCNRLDISKAISILGYSPPESAENDIATYAKQYKYLE
ncbi:NAD-dependent epimerase/dehydratase family protein [Akkermansiaceae bacterium]|nr:NAD-dependent epimerase/dehydratase family protein [Akkermansiaceae bacterium]